MNNNDAYYNDFTISISETSRAYAIQIYIRGFLPHITLHGQISRIPEAQFAHAQCFLIPKFEC